LHGCIPTCGWERQVRTTNAWPPSTEGMGTGGIRAPLNLGVLSGLVSLRVVPRPQSRPGIGDARGASAHIPLVPQAGLAAGLGQKRDLEPASMIS
jgi:hypothetical protein